jgi:hypothetical protein
MKNQYFGDVNDYRKYGLLRGLQAAGFRRLLVAWMLTPDDGGRDGGFRSYLDSPQRWACCDPELYMVLQRLLSEKSRPEVALIETSGLLREASFYSAIVPDGKADRMVWMQGMLKAAQGIDLVFVDPDNGIEIPSRPIGRKGSSKYVTWTELEALWRAGCSLLVYQHFRRELRIHFASRLADEFRSRTGAQLVEAFRTPHVLFLLAVQGRDADLVSGLWTGLMCQWNEQIVAMGLANPSLQPTNGAGGVGEFQSLASAARG